MANQEMIMRALELIMESFSGEYFISSDPKKMDISFVHDWLANESYWCKGIPYAIVERTISHSLCFGVYHQNGEQVGFGRVVTDYTTFAWVTDVFIIEAHRRRGLSRELMNCILEHPELRLVRRWLLGTDLAHGLYRKLGFEDLDHPENFLTLHRSEMYTSGEYDQLIEEFFH
jgi:GNAT superfamily N-acetyltransferase